MGKTTRTFAVWDFRPNSSLVNDSLLIKNDIMVTKWSQILNMKSIGVRQFRDQASHFIASKEIIAIKKHQKIVGFYIPISQSSEDEIQQAFQRLSATVNSALAESGLSEDQLSEAFDLSLKEEE